MNWKNENGLFWKKNKKYKLQDRMLISKYWCFSACPDYVPDNQLILFLGENFRNSSGTKTEKLKKLKNRKTEFSREIQEEILHMDSVFCFSVFCFSVLLTELFRNICGETENWISRENQEEILHMDSVFLFFCFSVLLTELFRNICGDISEYLQGNRKTWKSEFSREIQEEILHMDSVFQFFSIVAE